MPALYKLIYTLVFLGSVHSYYFPSFLKEKLFASKTSYEVGRQKLASFLQTIGAQHRLLQLDDASLYPAAKCQPRQLSLVVRHGSRYPTVGDMRSMATLQRKLEQIDVRDHFKDLKAWNANYDKKDELKLSATGEIELSEIGQRFAKAFPQLFRSSLTNLGEKAEIYSSSKSRAIDSGVNFLKGALHVLGLQSDNVTASHLDIRNDLLRYYDYCSKYTVEVDDNDDAKIEATKFYSGPVIGRATRYLSRRVSRTGRPDIFDKDDLDTIYAVCGFELALNRSRLGRKWCDTLCLSDTHAMEYEYDLKSYWTKTYGNKLNYEHSCRLFADVVNNLMEIKTDSRAPGVSVYFGHSQSIAPLHALLGIFKDRMALNASNYNLYNLFRKQRTSLTIPFSGNVGLVLYECQQGEQTSTSSWPKSLSKYMVQLLVNEYVIEFPFTDKSAVSLNEFVDHYDKYIDQCNFDQMCENSS